MATAGRPVMMGKVTYLPVQSVTAPQRKRLGMLISDIKDTKPAALAAVMAKPS